MAIDDRTARWVLVFTLVGLCAFCIVYNALVPRYELPPGLMYLLTAITTFVLGGEAMGAGVNAARKMKARPKEPPE